MLCCRPLTRKNDRNGCPTYTKHYVPEGGLSIKIVTMHLNWIKVKMKCGFTEVYIAALTQSYKIHIKFINITVFEDSFFVFKTDFLKQKWRLLHKSNSNS